VSGQLASQVNWTGRTQLIGGLGVWWRQLGAYGTAFWSVNGTRDPLRADPGSRRFARLADSGVTLSLTWDLELAGQHDLQLEVRQTVPLDVGGFDTAVGLRWRVDFVGRGPEHAW
jgi:hypothetical protein